MLTDNVFIVHLVRVDITPLFLSLYAIDTGALKDLDLAIVHEKELADCTGVINGMLSLSNYDIGMLSSWKIYGARLASCSAGAVHLLPGKLEVLHRPKLERLCWDGWICPNAPLSLGVVSSITELRLICIAVPGFKPSNVLRGSTAIQDLTSSFQRENLWLRPERKLPLHDIFIEFDMLRRMIL